MRVRNWVVGALFAMLAGAMPAAAQPFLFGESNLFGQPLAPNRLIVNGTIELADFDRGSYGNLPCCGFDHFAENDNYVVGELFFGQEFLGSYNNFFVFELPSRLATILATSLTLRVYSFVVDTPAGSTYRLYDVATPVATLLAGGAGPALEPIYNDLGSGTTYGARGYTNADGGAAVFREIVLNAAAIADFNAAIAQIGDEPAYFAIGGTLTAAEAVVPAPASLAVFGMGLAGLLLARRRRAA
ncbi:PEP-CTERM sorting domain-containing protein [Falsiroseomonas oryzae]|uniref:PEP-CTERM sorting domain-containing protein n=1 Tax=Falsiroseomonas oryzae TaxID=2766473 RepID=UPI0022EB5720|nr:PEP-CTERM sorting domain-containing protein [Roseomonas sp. MO-31]